MPRPRITAAQRKALTLEAGRKAFAERYGVEPDTAHIVRGDVARFRSGAHLWAEYYLQRGKARLLRAHDRSIFAAD